MLELILIVLFILWVCGAFIVPIGGSAIHLLLVIFLIVLLFRIFQNRNL